MSSIDAYGEMELPEEKSVIEVVEDPVKTVMSCYEMYEMRLKKRRSKGYSLNEAQDIAVKIFEGKEKLKPMPKELKKIFDSCENIKTTFNKHEFLAIFLTAMHNQTSLDTMIINRNFWNVGNKLKKEKKLVIPSGIEVDCVAFEGEGTVINYGEIHSLGFKAKNELTFNYGKIKYIYKSHEGIILNNGEIEPNSQNIDLVLTNIDLTSTNTVKKYIISLKEMEENLALKFEFAKTKQKLEDKLREMKFLETLPELPYEEQYARVDAFDFKKFEKELKEIVEEMHNETTEVYDDD